MPNITETISLLDELMWKIENWQFENSEDARTYIQYKFPQLQALRQAALDGERYRKAGEEEVKRFMETMQRRAEEITPNLLLNEIVNYAYSRMEELEAYRQAVEEK